MSLPRMQIYLYGEDKLLMNTDTYKADIHLGEKIICYDIDGLKRLFVAREIVHDPESNETIIWAERCYNLANSKA